MKKLELAFCLVWVAICGGAFLFHETRTGRGQVAESPVASSFPDIEAFDKVVQKRFLTEPGFGRARLVSIPLTPQPLRSEHIKSFLPVNDDERSLMAGFEEDGINIALYLFGKRTMPNSPEKHPLKNFKIRYRVNEPVPISPGLNVKDLISSKKIIDEIKTAFTNFQTSTGETSSRFEFRKGDWTYVAKPVRALQSCLQCHTDYVVLEKLEKDRLKVRKRDVGDVNGVIVYAFSKKERTEK